MKRSLIALSVILILGTLSCAKKERLGADTLYVGIDLPTRVVAIGGTIAMKVIAHSGKASVVAVNPAWSVESPNLGSFSPATGAETLFTASTAGTGTIYADCGGVRGSVAITVVTSTSSGGGTPSPDYFGLFSEIYASPTYLEIKIDTANPPDADGGALGTWGGATGNLNDGTLAGEMTEGSKGLKCVLPGGSPGGWWMQFGSDNIAGLGGGDTRVAKDMSHFSGGHIRFDYKTTQNISLKIEWTSGSNEQSFAALGLTTDGNWHSAAVPIATMGALSSNLSTVQVPIGFHTSTSGFTFYIDNVRWTKD